MQSEVCKRVKISKKTYYNYVHSDIIPSNKLIEFSKLFECSTDYLLGVSDYTHILVTDLDNNLFAVIDSKKVIEHSDCKIIFAED